MAPTAWARSEVGNNEIGGANVPQPAEKSVTFFRLYSAGNSCLSSPNGQGCLGSHSWWHWRIKMLRAEDWVWQTLSKLERERHHFWANQQLWPIYLHMHIEEKLPYGTLQAGPAVVTRNSNGDIVEASGLNSESLQIGKLKMLCRSHKGPEISVMWYYPYGWPLPFNIQIKWPNATPYGNRIFLSFFPGISLSFWIWK